MHSASSLTPVSGLSTTPWAMHLARASTSVSTSPTVPPPPPPPSAAAVTTAAGAGQVGEVGQSAAAAVAATAGAGVGRRGHGAAASVSPPPPPPPVVVEPPVVAAATAAGRRGGRSCGLLRPGADRLGGGHEVAGGAGAVGDRGEVAVEVGVHERQHQVDVVLAVVVAEDRGALAGVAGEVVVAGAEVDGGGEGGVVDVLRVALAVVVGVDADDRPGGGDELHRADGAVPLRVGVVLAGVGVADDGGVVAAVERDAEDARGGEALVVEGVAVGAAVVGLDAADRGDQLPGEVAGLVGGVDDGLGALVGGERGGGMPEVEAVATAPSMAFFGTRGDHAGARQAGGGLDGLGRDGAAVGQRRDRALVGDRGAWRRRRRAPPSTRPRAGPAAPAPWPSGIEMPPCGRLSLGSVVPGSCSLKHGDTRTNEAVGVTEVTPAVTRRVVTKVRTAPRPPQGTGAGGARGQWRR